MLVIIHTTRFNCARPKFENVVIWTLKVKLKAGCNTGRFEVCVRVFKIASIITANKYANGKKHHACESEWSCMFNFGAFVRDNTLKLNKAFPMYICVRGDEAYETPIYASIYVYFIIFIINFNVHYQRTNVRLTQRPVVTMRFKRGHMYSCKSLYCVRVFNIVAIPKKTNVRDRIAPCVTNLNMRDSSRTDVTERVSLLRDVCEYKLILTCMMCMFNFWRFNRWKSLKISDTSNWIVYSV